MPDWRYTVPHLTVTSVMCGEPTPQQRIAAVRKARRQLTATSVLCGGALVAAACASGLDGSLLPSALNMAHNQQARHPVMHTQVVLLPYADLQPTALRVPRSPPFQGQAADLSVPAQPVVAPDWSGVDRPMTAFTQAVVTAFDDSAENHEYPVATQHLHHHWVHHYTDHWAVAYHHHYRVRLAYHHAHHRTHRAMFAHHRQSEPVLTIASQQ